MSMLIKDLISGSVREYGNNCHDSLIISQDGKSLSYYNLQNGDGSMYGDYRFVMEDEKVPEESNEPDAIHAECYFNVGGFLDEEAIRADERAKVVDEVIKRVCDRLTTYEVCDNIEIDLNSFYDELKEIKKQIKEQNATK